MPRTNSTFINITSRVAKSTHTIDQSKHTSTWIKWSHMEADSLLCPVRQFLFFCLFPRLDIVVERLLAGVPDMLLYKTEQ